MTLLDFEELLSAWLDEPGDVARRARIDAAVQAEPGWAGELARWEKLNAALRATPPALQRVDWPRAGQRMARHVATTAAAAPELRLDELLADEPAALAGVDWTRVRTRISAAVTAERPARLRHARRWYLGAAAGLAAAAAIFLAVTTYDARLPHAPATVNVARVSGPTGVLRGSAYAKISAPPEVAAQPTQFFIVDPIRKTQPEDPAEYF
jgi:hypothetical protein